MDGNYSSPRAGDAAGTAIQSFLCLFLITMNEIRAEIQLNLHALSR